MAIDNVKIGNKLNIGEGGSSSSGATEKVDPRMTMNGSIFAGASAESKSASSDNGCDYGAISDGQSSNSEAKGWASKCDQISENSKETTAQMKNFFTTIKTKSNQAKAESNKADTQTAALNGENETTNGEIEELTTKRDELLAEIQSGEDKTGSGKSSALSLTVGGGSKPQGKTTPGQTDKTEQTDETQGDDVKAKQSELEEVQSQLESKNSTVSTNTNTINSISTSVKKTVNNLRQYCKQALAGAKTAAAKTEKNQQLTQTAAGVGTTATTTGGFLVTTGTAAKTKGTAMLAAPDPSGVTKVLGGALVAYGTKATVVGVPLGVTGGVVTAGSAIAKNDAMGAMTAVTSTVNSASSMSKTTSAADTKKTPEKTK